MVMNYCSMFLGGERGKFNDKPAVKGWVVRVIFVKIGYGLWNWNWKIIGRIILHINIPWVWCLNTVDTIISGLFQAENPRCTSKIVGMVKNCQMFGNFHGDPKIEATPKTHLQTAKLPYLLVKTMISYSKPFHFLGPDNTRWGVLPHRRRDTPHRCCLGDKKNVNQRHRRSVSRCFNQKKKELPWYTLVCVCVYIYNTYIYIYIGHIYR